MYKLFTCVIIIKKKRHTTNFTINDRLTVDRGTRTRGGSPIRPFKFRRVAVRNRVELGRTPRKTDVSDGKWVNEKKNGTIKTTWLFAESKARIWISWYTRRASWPLHNRCPSLWCRPKSSVHPGLWLATDRQSLPLKVKRNKWIFFFLVYCRASKLKREFRWTYRCRTKRRASVWDGKSYDRDRVKK